MRAIMKLSLLAMCALFVAACGGAAGDSGERDVAQSALNAFKNGDASDAYDLMSPEDQAGLVLEFNARLKQWSDLSKEAQESALKEINEKLWWDTEWEKVSKLEELEGFGDDEKISYELRGFREYSSKERVEDFEKRMDAFELVGYSRSFSGATLDWGEATLMYGNAYGDSFQVKLEQRAGSWHVSSPPDVRFTDMRSKDETLEARKKDE